MKFGKEFVSQMVPEWEEAYMDYRLMKTLLKELQLFKQRNNPATSRPDGLKRSLTLYRAFSGLTHWLNSPRAQPSPDVENQVIIANNVSRDGNERSETVFLMAADYGGEYELVYFKRLDDEFNKVSKFYKAKVEEVMNKAMALNKQMEALVAYRVKVENSNGGTNRLEETTQLASDVTASTAATFAKAPSAIRASRRAPMDVINEEGSSKQQSDELGDDDDSRDGVVMKEVDVEIEEAEQSEKRKRPAPLEILERVKFNTSQETPRSTIKGFLNLPNQTDLKFSKDSLKKAEDQLKRAFVEFYHKLRLLKSYSYLNIMAFSKIMKKYDKIASRNASRAYMKMVDNSYLSSSDEVSKLMVRVEAIFVKHFSNSNRSKGMKILRPQKKREKHRLTFYMGFLFGCTFALVIALVLVIRARNILEEGNEGRQLYMETMFPLYSLFGFVVLHMLMYAGNIYFWRRYRVNYSFIFGFKRGTELGYKEVLLLGFCISVLALASVLANLDMEMDPVTHDYKAATELLPLGLVLLLVVIMLCPLNIIYRSSRYFLLIGLCHCVLAPLYKVSLPDFILADQLTSQVQALRSLEFYICYYGWGDYKHRRNNCKTSHVFKTFSFIVAAIPYWWRLLQCLRRLYDERDPMQGYNGLKYLSTIVAVCARTAYTLNKGINWKIIALVASVIATIVSTYWDIIFDWGLFQRKSKNRWLRDKLLVPHKSVYFVAIGLNVLLRLAWMQTVMNITVFSLHTQTMTALVASLEIIRRGVWNFFRLENEHLNVSSLGSYQDKSRKERSIYIHIKTHTYVRVEMEVIRNKFVVAKRHIDGAPTEADFSVGEETLPLKLNSAQVAENAVMVKNLYVSIDPYQINRLKSHGVSQTIIPAAPPGKAIEANGVGKVVESAHPDFKAGDIVSGSLHWGQYSVVKGGGTLHKLNISTGFPLSYYAGSVLGSSGLTAYVGFHHICKPQKGDKVFVSAAAGSVGVLVGQYAKLFGCYVVGCAGTKEKVDLLKEVGFDDAFNYKEETNLASALQRCFPEGIDIYFDNVGGEMLDAAIENMNAFGRVAACGVISEYTERENRAKPDMMAVVYKRIRIEGFLLVDFVHVYEEFISTTVQHLQTGKMKAIEDISYGVESIPTAFVDLFRGNNVGKKVVEIAQGC